MARFYNDGVIEESIKFWLCGNSAFQCYILWGDWNVLVLTICFNMLLHLNLICVNPDCELWNINLDDVWKMYLPVDATLTWWQRLFNLNFWLSIKSWKYQNFNLLFHLITWKISSTPKESQRSFYSSRMKHSLCPSFVSYRSQDKA